MIMRPLPAGATALPLGAILDTAEMAGLVATTSLLGIGTRGVVLDASALVQIDSAVVGALTAFVAQHRATGRTVHLYAVTGEVCNQMHTLGLDDLFDSVAG